MYKSIKNKRKMISIFMALFIVLQLAIPLGILAGNTEGQLSTTDSRSLSLAPSTTETPMTTPDQKLASTLDQMEYKVETVFSSQTLVPNRTMTAEVTASNISVTPFTGSRDVLVIVGLYDPKNTMVNVSYISKGIGYLETETLSAGFKLPSNVTGYHMKAFMWDGTDIDTSKMIPLSNIAEIPENTATSPSPTLTPTQTIIPTQTTIPTPTIAFLDETTKTVGDWTLSTVSTSSVTNAAIDSTTGVSVTVAKTGTSEDDVRLIHTEAYALKSGEYKLTLPVDSSIARKARVSVEKADDSMEAFADQEVDLASGSNTLTVPFVMKADGAVTLPVSLGYFTADGKLASHTVTVGAASFERTGDYVDPSVPVEDPDRFKNKVTNGDFSNDAKPTNGWWGIDAVENGVGVKSVTGGTVNPWDVMAGNFATFQLQKGRTYSISFDVASEVEQDIKFQVVDSADKELTMKSVHVPAGKTLETFTFNDFEVNDDCLAKFACQLGGFGTIDLTYNFYIDNVVIKEVPKIVNVVTGNSDFSKTDKPTGNWWGIDSVENGVGVKSVAGGKANPWDVMAGYFALFQLQKGRTYNISLDLASEVEQDIKFQVVDSADKELTMKTIHVPAGTTLQTFTFDGFEVNEDCLAKFAFQLGGFGTTDQSYNVYIDNVNFSYPDLATSVVKEDPKANMVKNFDFAAGTKNWGSYAQKDGVGTFKVVDGEAVVNITNTGTEDYAVQFYQDGLKLYKGNKYKFSFRYKADTERTGGVRIQQNGGTYTGYLDDSTLAFTNEWKTYEKEFTMAYDNDTAARLAFNLGVAGVATEVNQNIYFDDFSLIMTEGIVPGEAKVNPIRLNQVGYRPNDAKVAFIVSADRTFKLYTKDDKLVMTGNLPLYTVDAQGGALVDSNSGDTVRAADFTALKLDGNYYVKVRSSKSPTFAINQKVYEGVTAATLKVFYYQQCGGNGLDTKYVGDIFAHDPCHTGTAKYYDPTDAIYGNVDVDVSGGWHDAGDYGRYITPASKTVADLLMTAESFPSIKDLDFGGPEKILNEARYEIEWMLKMQNPQTGGVYHKVTTKNHAGMTVLPEADMEQLYLSPVSAQATGDFAAAMAYAYRMYNKVDPTFAEKCLAAAEKAWGWLEANPDANAYTDPSFFGTGTYADGNATDERFWAAAELYKTTQKAGYLDFISNNTLPSAGFGWADMGSYALEAYLTTESVDKNSTMYTGIKGRFISDANKIVATWKKDGYKVALDDYVWGSNKDLSDRAMILIIANKLAPNPDYDAAILDQLDYLLGRNANDISYVTGFGEKAAQHPHHRQSIILKQAVPGMLVGGPNGYIMSVDGDPVAKMVDENTPKAKCYADVDGSYATNEICIYWNSPLVYVLSYLYGK